MDAEYSGMNVQHFPDRDKIMRILLANGFGDIKHITNHGAKYSYCKENGSAYSAFWEPFIWDYFGLLKEFENNKSHICEQYEQFNNINEFTISSMYKGEHKLFNITIG
jgi:hypothetical protein